ncbi:MAG: EPSP synthase (3-phosphoshikimate 1-carboxyvinyltransferase) superfamily [candidate division WS6 bacterium GW2011_GWF2_39_15]|uniref:UDP-N-acetylglucosamine 1-carboxyvinyltransferase n=1 Tax=candidate division WS6 bacterium GW2011_GWF2_39_15 TaxID=1619100 RepID=A0A0G0QXV4_9BACT|nr:MAG: EPSP synthase (3-phosphoshikimate 1-carboxyvinyltransferase) superfamily [candidate division WS6 bacterium GW2011_GWF2_39_15]
MSNIIIHGGNPLNGDITPSGNKNSVLPILCSTILTNETVVLNNVPDLTDVNKLVEQLKSIGSKIEWDKMKCRLEINNKDIRKDLFDGDFPIGMRGSLLLFSPLLYRMKKLQMKNEIGGCSLGIREIDPHIDALKALGTKVSYGSVMKFSIQERFVGNGLWPDYMSVTATENFINAAVLASGRSKLVNAASEPHVQDLCNFLNGLGAKITGIGTSVLEIDGVESLGGGEFTITSDHHEITTMLALGAMTGGEIRVHDAIPQHFPLIKNSFAKLGVEIEYEGETAIVRKNQKLKIQRPFTENMLPKIEAAPWPYFPVDLLPLMIALSVKSKGEIMFWNKVYEGGFFWIQELMKFGSEIILADPHRVIVFGGRPLSPAVTNAPNIIRAAIALTMVALSIEGESKVNFADSIKRAHPNFIENLQKLGAKIDWEE